MINSFKSSLGPLAKLSAPVVGLNLLNVLALFVDNVMAGRLPNNTTVLAALGYGTSLIFVFVVAMMGLAVGTVALISRAVGAGDCKRANHILHQSFWLTMLVGGGVAIFGLACGPTLISAMGADAVTTDLAMDYLTPLFVGTFAYYLNILFGSTLRGTGHTVVPFIISIVVNALNVTLNYCLIFGEFGFPRLELAGAAYGTVIAQSAGVLCYFWYLKFAKKRPVTLNFFPLKLVADTCKKLIQVGLPAAIDMIVFNVGIIAIVKMLSYFGDHNVGAHNVGFRVQAVAFIPGLSISQAAAALIGQALGASNRDKANELLRAAVFLCICVMASLALLSTIFAEDVVQMFDVRPGDPVFAPSVIWVLILGISMPIFGVHIALIGLFRGSGQPMIALKVNVIITLILQIPLSYVFGFVFGWGPAGIWGAFPAAFFIKMLWLGLEFRRGNWVVLGKHAHGGKSLPRGDGTSDDSGGAVVGAPTEHDAANAPST